MNARSQMFFATMGYGDKSLIILKEKADNNRISFPAIKKKLAEFEKNYSSAFPLIQFNLREPTLTWRTIDELENKERKLDGHYLLKTNRFDLDQDMIWSRWASA